MLGSRLQSAGPGAWGNLGDAKGLRVSGQVGLSWGLREKFRSQAVKHGLVEVLRLCVLRQP